MSCRETQQAASVTAANAATAASVVKTEAPATAHPSPELTAHAVSCSSLSGSECAATRVADSPCGDHPAAAAATVAESVVSPRTVAATLVRISVRSADGVTATPDGERGSFNRRSGSSEQCHPDGATEAALAMRHGNVSSPGALPAVGGRASPACAAAPALPVSLRPAFGRLPFPPAAFEGVYQDRSPVQQQQGQAAEPAVRDLDTSTILQQAAALTANAVGNRLWDLAPSALLAMHKQAQQHEEQQHGSLGVPQPATASGPRAPACSALVSQGQQPAMQLLPPRQENTPFTAHDLFMRGGGGVHPLALLQFQQQLAAVQQQPRHFEQLLAPHADRPDPGTRHIHHTLVTTTEAFDPGHGGRTAGGAPPPIRTGLQSSSASAPAVGAADRSGRRVVSGNEAAPRDGAQDHRSAGLGSSQEAVTLQEMQQAAVALVRQHREAMAQQGSPGRVKLPPPDDEVDPCAPAAGHSGCGTHAKSTVLWRFLI